MRGGGGGDRGAQGHDRCLRHSRAHGTTPPFDQPCWCCWNAAAPLLAPLPAALPALCTRVEPGGSMPLPCPRLRQRQDEPDQRAGGAPAQGRIPDWSGAGQRHAQGPGVQGHHLLRAAGALREGEGGGAGRERASVVVLLVVVIGAVQSVSSAWQTSIIRPPVCSLWRHATGKLQRANEQQARPLVPAQLSV